MGAAIASAGAAALLPLAASSAADGFSRACSRGTTVVANAGARVFAVRDGDVELYACRKGDRRPLDLGFRSRTNGVSGVQLAGDVVGYRIAGEGCSRGTCTGDRVVSRSLRTRRLVRQVRGGATFVLKANGSLAAIVDAGGGAALRVERSDTTGIAVLDPGPVEADSLALAGSRVYWTAAGAARSATLD